MPHALGIRFQVNQHRPFGAHIARRAIELEVIPGNPIEAAGVLAVDDDLDVVQLRPSALFELHRLGGAHRKLSAAFAGVGDRKSFGGLLNVQADFRRNIVHGLAHTPARVEIHPRDRTNHQNRAQSEPPAQP